MTDTVKTLRASGVSVKRTGFGEYRVAFIGKSERYAAYETELPAAIATGRAMLTELAEQGFTLADLRDDLRVNGGR